MTTTAEQPTARIELTNAQYRQLRNILSAAGREEYQHAKFRNYRITSDAKYADKQRRVLQLCLEYADTWQERHDGGEGLVFWGTVGTGKDHLAFATVAKILCEHDGITADWISGRRLFSRLRDGMDDQHRPGEIEILRELTAPDILIISDPLPVIGALTQFQADFLFQLVDARSRHRLVTMPTINLTSAEEADNALGSPTWDRLINRAWLCECIWPSYRQPARKA